MADLSVKVCGVEFKTPIIPASGVFGYGREYAQYYPLSTLGGIAAKGTTPLKQNGNPAPRIAETPAGMLNSVGLQNPGMDAFLQDELPWLMQQDTVILANFAGPSPEACAESAAKLDATDVHMLELNISCPNVKNGGLAFGAVWGMYEVVCQKLLDGFIGGLIDIVAFEAVMIPLLVVFLGVGVIVGVFGGLIAIRDYLKV